MSEKTTVGGVPVECLTGEAGAVWSGWRILGDRELVREASAKGTHIGLACKCLAFRKSCSVEDAQNYFNREVETWIGEMLHKRQIYRASHILKNVGKNPIEYIFNICVKCKDGVLRNYLSEYMISVSRFEKEHVNAWNIIKSIGQFELKYGIENGLSSSICIEDIIKLDENVKQALCTELYLSTNEKQIIDNVTNTTVWDYLLSNNEVGMLQYWISAYYKDENIENSNDYEQHKPLLSSLDITSSMIEGIDCSNATDPVKDLVKNHLCRYGIFTKQEQSDLKSILARIFGSQLTLKQYTEILTYKSCNIDKNEFFNNIDRELCLARCISENDTPQDRTKTMELYESLVKMCESQSSDRREQILIEGIFETIHYISDDPNQFLRDNYLIVLALVFLVLFKTEEETKSQNDEPTPKSDRLREIFNSKTDLQIGSYTIPAEILQHALNQVSILQDIIEDKPTPEEATMYDLLDGYRNLNTKQVFRWRFNNLSMPTFSNNFLVEKYGYSETLTYGYYLKEGRPNMAIFSLKHVRGKTANISSRRKTKAAFHAHLLAMRNLDRPEILCSCISFIEMLGMDSENLRLYVTVANYILKEINVPIGDILENIMYKSENDLKFLISLVEASFRNSLKDSDFVRDSQKFVDVLKTWDVIVRFARTHSTELPDCLINFLASQNYWFEFGLVCQIFAYPANQVLESAKKFDDKIMREHLLTCLCNAYLTKSQSVVQSEQKLKSRDVRQSLYYKIGVKQSSSPISGSPVSSSIETNSSDSYVTTSEYFSISENICSKEDDFWTTVLKCHQSPDPPRALINASRLTLQPIFTILATCYEPSSTAAYCYTWMVISAADNGILSDYRECLEQQIWTPSRVSDLQDRMLSAGYVNTLSRAYNIFMPDSPLNSFFEFVMQSVSYRNFKLSQQSLQEFKSQCSNLKCNKIMDWNCTDTTYLENLYWIAIVAVRCLVTTLACQLASSHLQIKFLETLTKCNIQTDLPVQIPDFQCLLQIARILLKTNVTFNFSAFDVSENTYSFGAEIQRCIHDLLNNENYSSTLELLNVAGLDTSDIILAQCRSEFKQLLEKFEKVGGEFWKECAANFEKHKVSPEKAAEFFVEHANKVSSHKERYEILRLAFEVLKDAETDRETIDTLEMAVWKSCILAGPENIYLGPADCNFNKLRTELLSGLSTLKVTCTLADKDEESAAEVLINKLLDSGKLDIALRISAMFNFNHKDLKVLMLCLSLAEGEILPSELNAEQKSLLMEPNKAKQQKYGIFKSRGLRRFSSSSSLNSTVVILSTGEANRTKHENVCRIQMEYLHTLERLLDVLEHGIDICLKVVLCYKLAVRLGKSYQLLLMLNSPLQFLQEISENNIENKVEIVSDIIKAYQISSKDIAVFLASNISANITSAIKDGCEDNICMWGYSLNINFHVIMELCSDVSLLGWQLLKTVNKLLGHTSGENRNVPTLKTVVELLIRSHDCFTAACNMEGIASVLRKCQNLANALQTLKLWALLVRLVTGVGRFTEMNYVFQILQENDQFEFLLGKGLDRVPGLKTALLEFLKRQCPENKELFTMVALHFRLYHEIALMWEGEAKDVIKGLIQDAIKDFEKLPTAGQQEIKLTRTEHVLKQLQLAMNNYTHATQYYLQDSKLNLASRCSDQAQLVSLQLSILGTVSNNQQSVQVLNLKPDEIDKILCHVLTFSQALIIMRAYNYHVDWANLIYSQCILNGKIKYLKDFTAVNKLTPAIVQDCARRYRLEKCITHTMPDNMKTLVAELSDVECKYMLASQLGFKDVVESMLNNPMIGAYLKDTVWKKGYSAI